MFVLKNLAEIFQHEHVDFFYEHLAEMFIVVSWLSIVKLAHGGTGPGLCS